jgi:hypothetical protein
MFSPHEQGPVFIERFGPADDDSVGHPDCHPLTEGAAAPHPLVAYFMEITPTEPSIRGVQLGEDGGREIRAIKGASPFDAQRGGDSAQFLGHFIGTEIDVDTDAQHDVPDVVEFGPEF